MQTCDWGLSSIQFICPLTILFCCPPELHCVCCLMTMNTPCTSWIMLTASTNSCPSLPIRCPKISHLCDTRQSRCSQVQLIWPMGLFSSAAQTALPELSGAGQCPLLLLAAPVRVRLRVILVGLKKLVDVFCSGQCSQPAVLLLCNSGTHVSYWGRWHYCILALPATTSQKVSLIQ